MARKPLITPGSFLGSPPQTPPLDDPIARIVERDRVKNGRTTVAQSADDKVSTTTEETAPDYEKKVTTRLQVVTSEPIDKLTTSSQLYEPETDYKTTSSQFENDTLGGAGNYTEQDIKDRAAGAVGGRRRRGERKSVIDIKKPRRPLSPEKAKAKIVGMVNSKHGVINFRGPEGLNERINAYLAEHYQDRPSKQDYVARALALVIYEMETGIELVNFGEDGKELS